MNGLSLEELGRRLDRVQQQNRRMKRIALVGTILLVAAFTVWQARIPTVLRAERFELKRDGKVCAVLKADEAGRPSLAFLGDDGGFMAGLFVFDTGPALHLYGKDGERSVALAVSDEGPMLALGDEQGKARAVLRLREQGLPQLAFFRNDGKPIGAFIIFDTGPALHLYGKDGERSVALAVSDEGAMLALGDEQGKVRAELRLGEQGRPQLAFFRNDGKPIGAFSIFDTGPALQLYGKDGECSVALAVSDEGPRLALGDENGKSRAVLGCTELKNESDGIVMKLPPSSLVLFDEQGNVTWRAP